MDWEKRLDQKLAADLPDLKILPDEPLKRYTSFRTGGPARRMAFPVRTEQFHQLMKMARECGITPCVIGNGTNLLVPDEGIDGLVITTRELRHMTDGVSYQASGGTLSGKLSHGTEHDAQNSTEYDAQDDAEHDIPAQDDAENYILAQAGCLLRRVAEFACERGLNGFAFAHGIPGTLGGAVCMNAGAYGGEMSQVVQGAEILFPDEIRYVSVEELHFGYRHSLLTEHPEAVVLCAVLRLQPGDPAEIRAQMKDLMERRRRSQPLEFPSAGSTFKRPPGHFAGTLIEQCGLKGLQIGGARVSDKHAGFIINTGDALSADVTALIAEVQKRVLEQTGVALEPEVKILPSRLPVSR